MTMSVALFDCPHCVDEFAFDYQRIAKLNYGYRVRVRCPGCGNVVEVIMLNYTLIHGGDPDKYKVGEIVEILRPDQNLSNDWWMEANTLRSAILQKKSGWRHTVENHNWIMNDGLLI